MCLGSAGAYRYPTLRVAAGAGGDEVVEGGRPTVRFGDRVVVGGCGVGAAVMAPVSVALEDDEA